MTPPATPARTLAPDRIGRYVVLGTAGEGAMGIVVRAHDPRLHRVVALKLLRTPTCDRARTRLVREAQALARLQHPNVVAVYDVDTHGGDVYVALEFVRGRSLDRWLCETGRACSEIVRMFAQAGRGLLAAHRRGLVHRDFKPQNVIVGEDGRARVVDFGLAWSDPGQPVGSRGADVGLTEHGFVLGTPAYMAPEQHVGDRLGPAADQFAFCIALWEALHGERPFAGFTADELAHAKLRGEIATPRRRVPKHVTAALRRGLARDPVDRWPSMAALLHALAAVPARRPWLPLVAALAGAVSCVCA